MRQSMILAATACLTLAAPAGAYEYGLQFTPNAGARALVVAGYAFKGKTVVGNCSYHTVTGGGSGRGGGGGHSTTTWYNQTCTWDLYGNLLSMVPGAPAAPTPLSTSGGLTIYARNAQGDTTGVDVANYNRGFVNARSAQYVWVTQPSYPSASSLSKLELTLTLQSVGDMPLVVHRIDPSVLLAKVSVKSSTCTKVAVTPGATCAIVLTYDPTGLPPGDDPYTAYDRLTVGIVSNSGQQPDFAETVEVAVAAGG